MNGFVNKNLPCFLYTDGGDQFKPSTSKLGFRSRLNSYFVRRITDITVTVLTVEDSLRLTNSVHTVSVEHLWYDEIKVLWIFCCRQSCLPRTIWCLFVVHSQAFVFSCFKEKGTIYIKQPCIFKVSSTRVDEVKFQPNSGGRVSLASLKQIGWATETASL